MKKIFTFLLVSQLVSTAHAQTYTVPGAQVQPAWVFPLWFEDGNGSRDTIYFCYDPLGDENYPSDDTIFGEKVKFMDTSMFWVGIWALPALDSSSQVYVGGNHPAANLILNKGFYPLIIKWDDTLFYSSSLPYPDLSPLPRARISIICSDAFGNCPSDIELSMTAVSSSFPFPLVDSAVFNGPDGVYVGNTLGEFTLELRSFDSPLEDAIVDPDVNDIKVFPTITDGGLWIESIEPLSEILILNSMGSIVGRTHFDLSKSKKYYDMSSFPAGVYLFIIQNNKGLMSFKTLKL